MEEYEELQRMLAEMVVWARGSTRCAEHPHFSFMLLTNDGHVPWHGPICEIPLDEQKSFVELGLLDHTWPCEWQDEKKELVGRAVEIMGGPDMSRYL